MDRHIARVAANILAKSRARTVPAALTEWAWTGSTEDHERPSEQCELCDQESLRYHFEIKNDLTGHVLQVGSKCILQWQVGVIEHGVRLGGTAAKKKLNDAVKRMQREACIKALASAIVGEGNPTAKDILESALAAYRNGKALTPNQVKVVFWRLDAPGIEYHPSFFKVDLKKVVRMEALRKMGDVPRSKVWKALSSAQKKAAIAAGIAPPPLSPPPNH